MNDDQMVQLLRDVPLPAEPMDRYASVAGRRRRADGRRPTVVGASLAVVALVATVSVVTLQDSTRKQSVSSLLSASPNTARVVTTVTTGKTTQSFEALVDFKNRSSIVRYPGGAYEMRQIGEDTWISGFPGLPKGKRWLHSRSKVSAGFPGFSSFLDPSQLLATIKAEGGEVRRVGTAEVDGVPTTRYQVDTPDDDPTLDRLDVYIDDQGRVRRMVIDVDSEGEQSDLHAEVNLKDFGVTVAVSPPPAAEVFERSDSGMTTTCTPATKDGSTSPTGVVQHCRSQGTSLLTGTGSPEDKARACELLRSQPVTEQFTQAKKDEILKVACG